LNVGLTVGLFVDGFDVVGEFVGAAVGFHVSALIPLKHCAFNKLIP
jgi:hypothetical protein